MPCGSYWEGKKVQQSLFKPDKPWGLQKVEGPIFQENRHIVGISFSALRTAALTLQEIFVVLIYVKRLNWSQGHGAAGRIMHMKNVNDPTRYQTRNLPACSAVPHPTAPARALVIVGNNTYRI